MAQVKKLLSHYADHIDCLSVSYHQALEDPARTATRVNTFLGGGLNQQAMAATVEPTLRRQHRA